jgi:hypothetical protein
MRAVQATPNVTGFGQFHLNEPDIATALAITPWLPSHPVTLPQ